MGSFAVAKVCELVGEYILSKLRLLLEEKSVELCSNDGFAILSHVSGHDAELTRVPTNLIASQIAPYHMGLNQRKQPLRVKFFKTFLVRNLLKHIY